MYRWNNFYATVLYGPTRRMRAVVGLHAFFVSKNHAYKNIEAQICLKFKNIFLLVAISFSFTASDEI